MKNLRNFTLLLFLLCVATSFSFAQKRSFKDSLAAFPPFAYNTSIIKTNPLAAIWGSVPFTAEFRLMNEIVTFPSQSMQIGFSVFKKSPLLTLAENTTGPPNFIKIHISGFRMQYMYKFYIFKPAPKGIYIGPLASFYNIKIGTRYTKVYDYYYEATNFNLNVVLGRQTKRGRICVDSYIGMGYKNFTLSSHSLNKSLALDLSDNTWYNSHFNVCVGINAGIAFE